MINNKLICIILISILFYCCNKDCNKELDCNYKQSLLSGFFEVYVKSITKNKNTGNIGKIFRSGQSYYFNTNSGIYYRGGASTYFDWRFNCNSNSILLIYDLGWPKIKGIIFDTSSLNIIEYDSSVLKLQDYITEYVENGDSIVSENSPYLFKRH